MLIISRLLCVLCLLAVSICAFAADIPAEKPAIDLPVYPGAEVSMEVNLTSEDLIPTLKCEKPPQPVLMSKN